MADPVRVKKVKAYPIPAIFQIGTTATRAQIVKLTLQGFLAEVELNTLKPGDRFDCSFELPVLHHVVSSPGVVVKIYNQWNGSASTARPLEVVEADPTLPPPAGVNGRVSIECASPH